MVALLWVGVPCSVARKLRAPRPSPDHGWARWIRVGRFHFLAAGALLGGLYWPVPTQSWQGAASGCTAGWRARAAGLLTRAARPPRTGAAAHAGAGRAAAV